MLQRSLKGVCILVSSCPSVRSSWMLLMAWWPWHVYTMTLTFGDHHWVTFFLIWHTGAYHVYITNFIMNIRNDLLSLQVEIFLMILRKYLFFHPSSLIKSLWPIWRHGFESTLVREWFGAWRHQAIPWPVLTYHLHESNLPNKDAWFQSGRWHWKLYFF